jgi:hypothetical protein
MKTIKDMDFFTTHSFPGCWVMCMVVANGLISDAPRVS